MTGAVNVTSSITKNASNGFISCELFPELRGSFCFRIIAFSCIMFMSLIGNGLVCYGATRRRKRPLSYHLVTNLAVAELTYTFTRPFQFFYNTKPYSWIFGGFLCHVIDPLTQCTTLVITFTLATISLYRCIMMLQPKRYRPSTRFAYTVIVFSWIWGIVLSLPDSVTRTVEKHEPCNVLLCNSDVNLSDYRMTIFMLNSVVPFIILVLSYSSVIFRVRKHFLKSKQESIQLHSIVSLGKTSSAISNDSKQQPQTSDKGVNKVSDDAQNVFKGSPPTNKMMRLEADVLNMIYLIILLFFLCFLPSNILFILTEGLGLKFVKHWHYYWLMMWYLDLLLMVPSALHPICYGANGLLLGHSLKLSFRKIKWKT